MIHTFQSCMSEVSDANLIFARLLSTMDVRAAHYGQA